MTGQPEPGSNDILTFDVTGLTVTELDVPRLAPHNIFDHHAHIRVGATVTFAGWLGPLMSNISHCEFTVALESVGPGYEGVLGTVEQDPAGANPFSVHLDYDMNNIAAQLTPGVYRLSATVIVHGRTPSNQLIQFPVMGFAETAVMIAEHPA